MATNFKFTYNIEGLVTAIEDAGVTYTLENPIPKNILKAKISGGEPIEISDTELIIL